MTTNNETPTAGAPSSCAHEDTVLECPFCLSGVDGDTHVCVVCQQAVAPRTVCLYCDEQVPA